MCTEKLHYVYVYKVNLNHCIAYIDVNCTDFHRRDIVTRAYRTCCYVYSATINTYTEEIYATVQCKGDVKCIACHRRTTVELIVNTIICTCSE